MDAYTGYFTKTAKKRGIDRLHYHIEEAEKKDVGIFNGSIMQMASSAEQLLFIEGDHAGFAGCAYTTSADEEGAHALINNIAQTASLNKVPYGQKPIHDLEAPKNAPISFDGNLMAERLLDAEKSVRVRIKSTEAFRMGVSHMRKKVSLINDRGQQMSDAYSHYTVFIYVMAKDGGFVQTSRQLRMFASGDFDLADLAMQAAEEASQMLGSGPCPGGRYNAVIKNSAFAELLGAFLPALYAEKCQNKMSFLRGKLNERIGSTAISVLEDQTGVIRRRFDDEGTLTAKKTLIDKGKLADYFHNNLSAAAEPEKRKSNGNGFRNSYNEGIATSYTNVVVESCGAEELISNMGEGILITSCDGIFAGVNPVSGDFSVISKGFMVRGGALAEPVSGITIGGSLYDILSSALETGSDSVTIRSNTGIVTSPSVMLSGIVVTG